MDDVLTLVYDELPPSINDVHEVKWIFAGGKRVATIGYTKRAQQWQQRFADRVGREHMREITEFVRRDRPADLYEVSIFVSLPAEKFLNKSWLETGKRKARSPYKVTDAANWTKLLHDAISSALGRIDDSRFAESSIRKIVRPEGPPALEILVIRRKPHEFGVPPEYIQEGS